MPRPNKPINPGRLHEPVASSRGSKWAKHASPEHADQYEPDGSILIDAITQETVARIDLTESDPTIAIAPTDEESSPTLASVTPMMPTKFRWESERSIDGRTYHRVDVRVYER